MQIVASLKEYRVRFNGALDKNWNMHMKDRERFLKRRWQCFKNTATQALHSYISALCTLLDPVVRPSFRNVPFSQNWAPPLSFSCLTDRTKRRQKGKTKWREAEPTRMGRTADNLGQRRTIVQISLCKLMKAFNWTNISTTVLLFHFSGLLLSSCQHTLTTAGSF